MITVTRAVFERTCRSRGYDPAACDGCIVAEQGGRLTVDETHAAYPRLRPQAGPTLVQMAHNFAKAAAAHVAAGMPQASEDEVARRYAICQQCEHYDGKACRKCGCPVVRERRFLSKLSWANEKCPIGRWGEPA